MPNMLQKLWSHKVQAIVLQRGEQVAARGKGFTDKRMEYPAAAPGASGQAGRRSRSCTNRLAACGGYAVFCLDGQHGMTDSSTLSK